MSVIGCIQIILIFHPMSNEICMIIRSSLKLGHFIALVGAAEVLNRQCRDDDGKQQHNQCHPTQQPCRLHLAAMGLMVFFAMRQFAGVAGGHTQHATQPPSAGAIFVLPNLAGADDALVGSGFLWGGHERLACQPIAPPAQSDEIFWLVHVWLQLGAQATDQLLDTGVIHGVQIIFAPYIGYDRVLIHDLV